MRPRLDNLPSEIMRNIFAYLDDGDLITVAESGNRKIQEVAFAELLYRDSPAANRWQDNMFLTLLVTPDGEHFLHNKHGLFNGNFLVLYAKTKAEADSDATFLCLLNAYYRRQFFHDDPVDIPLSQQLSQRRDAQFMTAVHLLSDETRLYALYGLLKDDQSTQAKVAEELWGRFFLEPLQVKKGDAELLAFLDVKPAFIHLPIGSIISSLFENSQNSKKIIFLKAIQITRNQLHPEQITQIITDILLPSVRKNGRNRYVLEETCYALKALVPLLHDRILLLQIYDALLPYIYNRNVIKTIHHAACDVLNTLALPLQDKIERVVSTLLERVNLKGETRVRQKACDALSALAPSLQAPQFAAVIAALLARINCLNENAGVRQSACDALSVFIPSLEESQLADVIEVLLARASDLNVLKAACNVLNNLLTSLGTLQESQLTGVIEALLAHIHHLNVDINIHMAVCNALSAFAPSLQELQLTRVVNVLFARADDPEEDDDVREEIYRALADFAFSMQEQQVTRVMEELLARVNDLNEEKATRNLNCFALRGLAPLLQESQLELVVTTLLVYAHDLSANFFNDVCYTLAAIVPFLKNPQLIEAIINVFLHTIHILDKDARSKVFYTLRGTQKHLRPEQAEEYAKILCNKLEGASDELSDLIYATLTPLGLSYPEVQSTILSRLPKNTDNFPIEACKPTVATFLNSVFAPLPANPTPYVLPS